jgi:hypothetical protein
VEEVIEIFAVIGTTIEGSNEPVAPCFIATCELYERKVVQIHR